MSDCDHLKMKLAEQDGEDRDGFTEAETEFVRGVLERATFRDKGENK